MAIAKVIEVISSSTTGFEDAVSSGIAKASETVSNIEGAWVKCRPACKRDPVSGVIGV